MLSSFRTYNLAVELYGHCEKIKAKAYIRDQLMRASLSVVLNLAEGSAKSSEKDRMRFYNIAYGSIREVQAILRLMKCAETFKLADQVGACLFRLQSPKPGP